MFNLANMKLYYISLLNVQRRKQSKALKRSNYRYKDLIFFIYKYYKFSIWN